MSYSKFTKEEELVWKFLKNNRVIYNESNFKNEYVNFKVYSGNDISFPEFEKIISDFRAYYNILFQDHKTGFYSLKSSFKPNFISGPCGH